jgi:dephospho-CoA kinase
VFADPAALARLNQLVHPRILARLRTAIAGLAAAGHRGAVVVDAALMLDWGFERECDAVVAVTAPEPLQVARLVARGLSEADARARLARQRPEAGFAQAADAVLVNDADEAALAVRARAVLAALLAGRGLA